MLCGLVLKNQDLIDKDNFDKRNLGYLLIAVNVMVLLLAVGLAVVQFTRSNEDDYKSDNVVSIISRGIESHNTRSSENTEGANGEERGSSSLFDFFSGLRKTVVGRRYGSGQEDKKKMLEDGGQGRKNKKKTEMTMDEIMEASMGVDNDGLDIELSDIYSGGDAGGEAPLPLKPSYDADREANKTGASEWEIYHDEVSQNYFYVHKATGKTQWNKP